MRLSVALLGVALVDWASPTQGGDGATSTTTPLQGSVATEVYDPCVDIDDATLRSAGLNPATLQVWEPGANETWCSYASSAIDLTDLSWELGK